MRRTRAVDAEDDSAHRTVGRPGDGVNKRVQHCSYEQDTAPKGLCRRWWQAGLLM
jgi:hypothetical protein